MNKLKTMLVLLAVFIFYKSSAQINCNTLDVNKVPGKWVWQSKAPSFQDQIPASQWQVCEPIRKEMLRIMPVAIDGLYATNSIAFPKNKSIWYIPSSPNNYENYFMLKKYECLKGYNKLQPEGETGCWIYFSVNSLEGHNFPLPAGGNGMKFYANESGLRIANIEVKTDAAGNKIIYSQYRPEQVIKHCYFFSPRNDLPVRKITNKELYTSYKLHHEKRLAEAIPRQEKIAADYEKIYNSLSAAEKQKGDYRTQQYQTSAAYLKSLKEEKEKIIPWFTDALKQPNINAVAYVKNVDDYYFKPEELVVPAEEGYNVWVDNADFFDKTKPKDVIQCIALYLRRDDGDLPKKNFMDLVFSQFNLDVLAKIVGEQSKNPNGINTINASLGEQKITTKTNQATVNSYNYNFEKNSLNQFPAGWNGMKNNTVQQYENKNWLAFTKDGYCYPQQFNKEINNNFNLSFYLSWNKDIAYNSGLFTVSFSEIPYDNTGERYKMDDNQEQYWSFYDGYVGRFNRVMIWFDPDWNSGGTLEVYSYDKNENIGVRKRITLPEFYMAKNSHQLKIQRKGNSLLVIINDKKEVEIENVFIPSVKYNLYTFSRYKGNSSDKKNDVFYLNNIQVEY
jgi:hypothetical protein